MHVPSDGRCEALHVINSCIITVTVPTFCQAVSKVGGGPDEYVGGGYGFSPCANFFVCS